MNSKNLSFTRMIMFLINFVMISFLSIIIYQTTQIICNNDNARDFLETIKYVPIIPWKVPFFSIFLLMLLFLTVIIREKIFNSNKIIQYLFSLLDVLICICIMYYLNMSYKGILLLAIVNAIIYMDIRKKENIVLIFAIAIYIVFDYDILSIKIKMFSINDFIQYYSTTQRLYIFGIRNILISLNEICFIVFMIFVIQNYIDENNKTKKLYTELSQTTEQLKVANIQLRDYVKKSEELGKIRERNRLAREIHDTIGHALTGITTGLEACAEIIDYDVQKTKSQITKIMELARNGLQDVRNSVRELRPDVLDKFSLIPAVQRLCDDINGCTNIKVHLKVETQAYQLSHLEEETIYRIIQESITNSVRHGNAKNITILLFFLEAQVNLTIIDDGKGCVIIKENCGLTNIRERVARLHGVVEFCTNSQGGFTTTVDIPIGGDEK